MATDMAVGVTLVVCAALVGGLGTWQGSQGSG